MNATDFCYWLQGFFELSGASPDEPEAINSQQSATIQRHLNMVFAHDIDPKAGDDAHQAELSEIHNGWQEMQMIGGKDSDGRTLRC